MTVPPQGWFVIIFYAMFWPVRINGCIRRGRQPLLRGRDWFFDTRVPGGFYEGPGGRILRQYRLRMLIPFAADIPWAIWIFATGRLWQLTVLILAVSAIIHVNHLISKRIAERQAQPYAVPERTRPAARVALSLAPRRLRDYTHPRFERILALVSIGTLVWLTRYYLTSPLHPGMRAVFGAPLFLLYTQAGMLIVKRIVIGWPTSAPEDHADEHMRAAEERRRYYVTLWDWSRAASVAAMVVWPVTITLPRGAADRVTTVWLALCIVAGVVATVIVEIKRKQIAALDARATPVPLPNLRATDGLAWPLCYEPSARGLMLRSVHGYSLNVGNSVAQYFAAYVAGLGVLIFVLARMTP